MVLVSNELLEITPTLVCFASSTLFEVVSMVLLHRLLGAVIQKNNILFRRRGKEETLDCYTIKSEMKLQMVALFDMRIYCPRL